MKDFERMLSGRHARLIPKALAGSTLRFLKRLQEDGYAEGSLKHYASSSIHFALWLDGCGLTETDIDHTAVERFKSHTCRCPGSRRGRLVNAKYASRVRRLVEFLADVGLTSDASPKVATAAGESLEEYVHWMRQHGGLAESSIRRNTDVIARLLPALGTDASSYDAALVRDAFIADTNGRSRADSKRIATALRGYLRFLVAQGKCRPGLDHAIPRIPQWRLSSLPRYLPGDQIERIIDSCDLTRVVGVRDRAILLLLARLGLRAGDVVNLCLNDIDWDEATIRVVGKGRREARLPLPQDAGDAVLSYLETARPAAAHSQIFLRSMAPYQPLSSSTAVSRIVLRAIERAGVVNPPSYGANLMRHSAATSMLRAGATLEVVGTVLRHRHIDTTAHYAKVDVDILRQIAQPWPEAA